MRPSIREILEGISTEALLEEVVRRSNAEAKNAPVEHWCDDCSHFKYSKDERDTANNCQKGHTMKFRAPEDWPDEEYGFYRRVCPDRSPRAID